VQPRRISIALPQLFLGLLSLAIAAVWIAHIFSSTIHDAKHTDDTIEITGSARVPIQSNLVQWSLTVDGSAATPVEAARRQRQESAAVVAFLRESGIPAVAIAPEVVRSETETTKIDKKHSKTTYHVYQGVDVSTAAIDRVEAAATRIGDLLARGVTVSAEPLAYVSTDLDQAKLDALRAAVSEAKRRAEILVGGLGGKLGRMRATSLGVYQITPRNSTEVSDYGVNDTSSRLKDVRAVVSARFAVKS
jgi:uncharacterized protein